MLARLAHLFDRHMREYLVKALVVPIINLYDFIYAAASSSSLHRLDVAYNDLMRIIVGVRRSTHLRIADLHKLTNLDKLSERRQKSLLKFMHNVVEERVYSKLRLYVVKSDRTYSLRSQGYTVPRYNTNVGLQRIAVRGLSVLNQQSSVSS